MLKKHSSKELGTFEYDDEEYEIDDHYIDEDILKYIGSGKSIRLPKGCTSCSCMFKDYSGKVLDLSNFDTSKVTDMSYMFCNCETTSLDLSNFDTSNVVDMHGMFFECSFTVLDLSNFNTESVVDMGYMFKGFRGILNISSFNTLKVVTMESMFEGYTNINLDVSNFRTENVRSMSCMFCKCSCSYLDLSNFSTRNLENAISMFRSCYAYYLLLPTFNTEIDTYLILSGCNALIRQGDEKKLLGAYGKEVDKLLLKYRLLGNNDTTLYRKIDTDKKYIGLFYLNNLVGYRVLYLGKYYDIECGKLNFPFSETLDLKLVDGLLKSEEEVLQGLVVYRLEEHMSIVEELDCFKHLYVEAPTLTRRIK